MALYSIREGTNGVATEIIHSVFIEEMLHLTLAANILNAVGGAPNLDYPGIMPSYPTFLAHSNEAFQVGLHPSVAAIMIGPGGSKLRELEKETGRYFTFEGVDDAPLDLFEIKAEGSREEIERAAVPIAEGDELQVQIAEPHMYVETDAIARHYRMGCAADPGRI